MIEGGYQMIDWDGKRTKWGFWDPWNLNYDVENGENRGLNSLQLLSFLGAAEVLSKKYDIKAKFNYIEDHFIPLF